ncbi:hypothetical protein ACM0AZ_24995 [Mycobacteroides abscessus subsp. massiliense]|nr:hypothetical protein [Mycobacteroides abscessus]
MSSFEPARPPGADFHECDECGGSGAVGEDECPECDGTGEWFE